jgi:hypothetical protein
MVPPPLMQPAAAVHDVGRRAPHKPVYAVIALRLRSVRELERLADRISDPRSPRFRRFLTPAEFRLRFAPAPAQENQVIAALRAAGFTIVRTYPSRLAIDATASTRTAERFFGTRIDDVAERGFGVRYANVRPIRLPKSIARLVLGAEINSLVLERSAVVARPARSVLRNGGFEQGLRFWRACGALKPRLSRDHPFQGRFDALTGSPTRTSGSIHGFSAICQRVMIPPGGILRAALYGQTNMTTRKQGFAEVSLVRAPHDGKGAVILYRALLDNRRWKRMQWPLARYAGRSVYVAFGVYARQTQRRRYNSLFIDDVSLVGGTPSPSPSPTTSASPSPTPSASPSPTPSPVGTGPGMPLAGPTYGPDGGWAPRGIADSFDFPVQHGYDGRGVTVAVVIPYGFKPADLNGFLTYNAITRPGTVTQTPVAGGPGTGDPTEATLDAESIAGLAPGADIVLYEPPQLTAAYVLDAYAKALSDAKAAIVDSPFVQCDASDPAFDQGTDQDALSGAALGMTFVAASGDTGPACFDPSTGSNHAGTNAPASDPHVLAVGGNESQAPRKAAAPVVWSGLSAPSGVSFPGASGGGISAQWPIPSYQLGIAGTPASATQRNVPDISFPAVDDDVFVNGTHELAGGTSWSSSIVTALLAQAVEICGPLGWVDPAVYNVFKQFGEGVMFADVTQGSNAYASFTPYAASNGYDDASGIGMPNGFSFAAALCGRTTAPGQRHAGGRR